MEQAGRPIVKHRNVKSPVRTEKKRRAAALDLDTSVSVQAGKRLYSSIQAELERDHFGSYVMINTLTAEYVLGPTLSQAHADFMDRFGADTPGWCTRIGASIFAAI
jgi:hypothetical protein